MSREHNQRPADMSRPALSIRRSLAADQSRNMQEIMHGDSGSQQPPEPQHTRVRNLGRTIKDRGEVCQWIYGMVQEDNKTPVAPSLLSVKTSSVKLEANETTNATFPGVKDSKSSVPLARASYNSASSSRNDSLVLAESEHPSNNVSESEADIRKPYAKDKILASFEQAGSGEDVPFEEQLETIRQQQQHLLEKQRIIQKKIEQKQDEAKTRGEGTMPPAQGQDSQALLDTTQTTERAEADVQESSQKISGPGGMFVPENRRRRLKGTLASHYAKRDEGSIGSLLWSYDKDEKEERPPASSATTLNSASCVSAGRQANLKQESSNNISQLLSYSNFPDSQSCDKSSKPCTNERRAVVEGIKANKSERSEPMAENDSESKIYDCDCESFSSACVVSCTSCSEQSAPPKA